MELTLFSCDKQTKETIFSKRMNKLAVLLYITNKPGVFFLPDKQNVQIFVPDRQNLQFSVPEWQNSGFYSYLVDKILYFFLHLIYKIRYFSILYQQNSRLSIFDLINEICNFPYSTNEIRDLPNLINEIRNS